jgi:hypothetical protein
VRVLAGLAAGFLALAPAIGLGERGNGIHRVHGDWVGEMDGELVTWSFLDDHRARIGDRSGSYQVSNDTLRIHFAPPLRAADDTPAEVAVYRFLASDPQQGPLRLFVYGFDLGKRGIWLEPAPAEPPLPEDAAPVVPDSPTEATPPPAVTPGRTAAAAPAPRPR